ncbi:MAG: TPM domain-containing protein [Candidatus Binatus sp.]
MRTRCACADCDLRARWATLTLPLIFFLLILASPALASEPSFPTLTGRVVDDAGILNASTQSKLTQMLAAHERATGQQVVVVTLDSLQGYTIEDYGYQLGRRWGIGQKGKNNGVLLIVAPQEHKVRIEVGYGLEGELTDATCSTIIQNYVTPSFKRGNFNAGVLAGTTSILRVLGGNPLETGESATSSGENRSEPASSDKSVSNVPESIGFAVVALFFLIPLIGTVLLVWTLISSGRKFHWGGSHGWDSDGGSSGGSSDDDDDFSGGGGSFGGGGASGSW